MTNPICGVEEISYAKISHFFVGYEIFYFGFSHMLGRNIFKYTQTHLNVARKKCSYNNNKIGWIIFFFLFKTVEVSAKKDFKIFFYKER